MCWSARVSLLSSVFDIVVMGILYYRNKDTDRLYATVLLPIACQEVCQFALWVMGAPMSESCSVPNRVFSISAFLSAELVPIIQPLMQFLTGTSDNQAASSIRRRIRNLSLIIYMSQWILHIIALSLSKTYCVKLGENHHQMWVGDQSLFQLGGVAYYHLTMFLYLLSGVLGVLVMDIPRKEKLYFLGLGVTSFSIPFLLYPTTLEASSIWCWSALLIGVYALWLKPISMSNKKTL